MLFLYQFKFVFKFIKAHEIDKIKIVRIQSDLHATNSAKFKKSIYELTETKPQEYISVKNKILEKRKKKLEEENSKGFNLVFIFIFLLI